MIYPKTPEWHQIRLGIPTASNMYKLMVTLKNGEHSAEWNKYQAELISERMTNADQPNFVSDAMQHGIDTEIEALTEYALDQVVSLEHGYWVDKETWGCTPDAFVDDDGLTDVKCPFSKTFIYERLFDQTVPDKYLWQCVAQMAATNRSWCDLVYYDNRFTRQQDRLFIRRINRNFEYEQRMLKTIDEFNGEIDEKLSAIGFKWHRHAFPEEAPPIEESDDYISRYMSV